MEFDEIAVSIRVSKLHVPTFIHLDFQQDVPEESQVVTGFAKVLGFNCETIGERWTNPPTFRHGPAEVVYASADHGNADGVVFQGKGLFDDSPEETVSWDLFGKWLGRSEIFRENATLISGYCYGGLLENALAVLAWCPSIKWIVGPVAFASPSQLMQAALPCISSRVPGGLDMSLLGERISLLIGTKYAVWDREVLVRQIAEYRSGNRYLRFDPAEEARIVSAAQRAKRRTSRQRRKINSQSTESNVVDIREAV